MKDTPNHDSLTPRVLDRILADAGLNSPTPDSLAHKARMARKATQGLSENKNAPAAQESALPGIPNGYRRWSCSVCTASCNFEAMTMCQSPSDCGFDKDQPESLGGYFEFIIKDTSNPLDVSDDAAGDSYLSDARRPY